MMRTTAPINWQARVDALEAAQTRRTLHKPMAAREHESYLQTSDEWWRQRRSGNLCYLGHGGVRVRNLIGEELDRVTEQAR